MQLLSVLHKVQVHQSNDDVNGDDRFENVFDYETQSHGQPEYINDTYVVNQDDRNITPETPHVDLNGGKVEHNNVTHDQECASTALIIKKMKYEVIQCNKLNSELKAKIVSLTRDIECYKTQLSNMEHKIKHGKVMKKLFKNLTIKNKIFNIKCKI